MTDDSVCQIDNVSVTRQVIKGKKGTPCEQCGFVDWEKGDHCFIVEHWLDEESEHGAREHLCPNCALYRGLPENLYRKNARAPVLDVAATRLESQVVTGQLCALCHDGQEVMWGPYTAELIVVKSSTGVVQRVCLECVCQKLNYQSNAKNEMGGKAGDKRKRTGSKDIGDDLPTKKPAR